MTIKLSFLRVPQMALLIAVTVGAASEALAQQPSQAQLNAIRQSCRSDYMAHCSSVPTGGAPALNCLKQNLSTLSSACQQAVNAIAARPAAPTAPPVAAAPAPPKPPEAPAVAEPAVPAEPPAADAKKPSRAQLRGIRQACGADYRTHCAGILPSRSASIACLKRNATTLSAACQQALGAVAGTAPAAAAATAAPPPPAEPAPLLVTPREEPFMRRTACGRDFVRFCRGLRPGAGRIATCLHHNSADLSPRCQQALAALREGR
jgi:hypothetical protein